MGKYMDNLWIVYGYGWWLTYPSEKYGLVNWDDDIPNILKNKKCSNQTTNQMLGGAMSCRKSAS